MVINEDLIVAVGLKDSLDKSDVLIISDSSTVVDLSSNEVKHLVRDEVVSIEESLELHSADLEVLVGEAVGDVPTDCAELTSVLDDGVEEGEAEEELLVLVGLLTVVELSVVERSVGSQEVSFQTLRRLESDLDRVLKS